MPTISTEQHHNYIRGLLRESLIGVPYNNYSQNYTATQCLMNDVTIRGVYSPTSGSSGPEKADKRGRVRR